MLQKYNEKLRSLVSLRGKGGIPLDKWLPPELKKDGLYSLDVDQDIWQDYDLSDFEELPKWIIDPHPPPPHPDHHSPLCSTPDLPSPSLSLQTHPYPCLQPPFPAPSPQPNQH